MNTFGHIPLEVNFVPDVMPELFSDYCKTEKRNCFYQESGEYNMEPARLMLRAAAKNL